MRAIVDTDPRRDVIVLAAVSGLAWVLEIASSNNAGDYISMNGILLITLVGGPVFGLFYLYIGSAVFKLIGNWLGGDGSYTYLRAFIAWSSIPTILGLLLWIPQLALFGTDLFTSWTLRIFNEPLVTMLFYLIEIVLAIWALVISVKCLAEVHRFSAWRALGTYLISTLFLLPLFCCGLLIPFQG
jgi:hypothetical protein